MFENFDNQNSAIITLNETNIVEVILSKDAEFLIKDLSDDYTIRTNVKMKNVEVINHMNMVIIQVIPFYCYDSKKEYYYVKDWKVMDSSSIVMNLSLKDAIDIVYVKQLVNNDLN